MNHPEEMEWTYADTDEVKRRIDVRCQLHELPEGVRSDPLIGSVVPVKPELVSPPDTAHKGLVCCLRYVQCTHLDLADPSRSTLEVLHRSLGEDGRVVLETRQIGLDGLVEVKWRKLPQQEVGSGSGSVLRVKRWDGWCTSRSQPVCAYLSCDLRTDVATVLAQGRCWRSMVPERPMCNTTSLIGGQCMVGLSYLFVSAARSVSQEHAPSCHFCTTFCKPLPNGHYVQDS